MKYVEWVDHLWQTAARYADSNDEAAMYGVQTLRIPRELGFGEVAEQPGFTDGGGLWEAMLDAFHDLSDLGLADGRSQWTWKLSQDDIRANNLSLTSTWPDLFERIDLSAQEMDLLRAICQPGVGVEESEQWARRLWLESNDLFDQLGWDWDINKRWRALSNLKTKDAIGGSGFGGGNWRLHPTYIGIVVSTEQLRFEKKAVPEGSPTAFISYAHEDKYVAHKIAGGLQAADLDIEIDEHALAGGDSLVDWLADATKGVSYVIALVSQHPNESNWCKYEIALAMSDEMYLPGVKVIPVKVDKADMPNALRHKLYRSVPKLGINGVVEELVRDIQKHEERRAQAAAKGAGPK